MKPSLRIVIISPGKIVSADRIEIDPRLPDLMLLKVHFDGVLIHNPQLIFVSNALDNVLALTNDRSDWGLMGLNPSRGTSEGSNHEKLLLVSVP